MFFKMRTASSNLLCKCHMLLTLGVVWEVFFFRGIRQRSSINLILQFDISSAVQLATPYICTFCSAIAKRVGEVSK